MRVLLLAVFLGLGSSILASVEGQVRSENGEPVAGARIVLSSGESTLSDDQGRFRLQRNQSATSLAVHHPYFLPLEVALEPLGGRVLEIRLDSIQVTNDSVTISAAAPQTRFAPASATAASVAMPLGAPLGPLPDLLASTPGVALNGQGGPFQVMSVRGVSRQRLLTTLAGARLTSERRAGVSVSFIDPFLVDAVDVIRGPSSTFHGSGALGGVADIRPRRFRGPELISSFESQGREAMLGAGWGDGTWSVGVAARRADDGSTPEGVRLNSHFRQFSASIFRQWDLSEHSLQVLLIPAAGRDLGKVNSDYPERNTIYPEEDRLLAHIGLQSISGWRWEGFVQPHAVTTRVVDSKRRTHVENRSLDFGLKGSRHWVVGATTTVNLGAEYFGRRGVEAGEREYSPGGVLRSETWSLDRGREDELGLQAAASRYMGRTFLEAGLRLNAFRQGNGVETQVGTASWTGFVGGVVPLFRNLQVNGSLGSGIRFPSLSERFFSGITGRGEVVANRNLDSERSLSLEAGLKWRTERASASVQVFQNRVSDYIERVELDPGTTGFRNLVRGSIEGFEWDAGVSVVESLRLFTKGHRIRGEEKDGGPLADIPVARMAFGFQKQSGRLNIGSEWQFRSAKNRPGPEERYIDRSYPLTAFAGATLNGGFQLSAAVRNLWNQGYYDTADNRGTPAKGRSLVISLRWSGAGG